MDLCALQFDLAWEEPVANFAAVEQALASADPVPAPGSLLVLPELFAAGFTMTPAQVPDPEGTETENFLAATARKYRITLLGGVMRRLPDGQGANEAVAFSPEGERLCRYRKIHSFSPAGEAEAYTAGSEIVTFAWNGFTVAPLICYDLRFPELFRAAVARTGADLFCVMANWPARRQQHKTILLRARAIENQAFVLGVNRTGYDPHASYAGASVIIGPQGEVLAEAGKDPALLRARIDPATTTAWREQFPALRDRRTDLFPA